MAILSAFAVLLGIVSALVAKVLLVLIGFITDVAYFQRAAAHLVQPDPHRLGPIAILIPIFGGLVVGVIAKYGTDKIRGHGIPEAIQAILDRDSIIQARVAFLKTNTTCSSRGS